MFTETSKIMALMDEKYLHCTTYSDSGSVFLWDRGSRKPVCPKLQFKTFFVRPNRLRFEWTDENDKSNVIWCDGIKSYSMYWYHDAPEVQDSLALAVAGATGVSSSSAYNVPSLLIPEVRKNSNHLMKRLYELRSGPHQLLAGLDCYRLTGSAFSKDDTELWVARNDCSLRQMIELVVITLAQAEQIQKEAIERGIEFSSKPKEQAYFTQYCYEQITFDEPIAPEVFNVDSQ